MSEGHEGITLNRIAGCPTSGWGSSRSTAYSCVTTFFDCPSTRLMVSIPSSSLAEPLTDELDMESAPLGKSSDQPDQTFDVANPDALTGRRVFHQPFAVR